MDNIYTVPSNLININEQLKIFQSELNFGENCSLPQNDNEIKKLLDIEDHDQFKEIEKSVDLVENLNHPDDVRVLAFKPTSARFSNHRNPVVKIPKEALHLNTFREVVRIKKKYLGSALGRSVYRFKHLETTYSSEIRDLKPYEDVLISVRFYRPFRYTELGQAVGPKFAEEFYVRGQQFLTELRDKITCECTNKPLYDISENPEQERSEIIDSNPGFFFINDTFYNDMRNPKNADYSETIRNWAEARKEGTFSEEFQSAKMEDTKFVDLKVRLGFPQVYQHFGNCEHLFTFSWIRLLAPGDHLLSCDYPIVNSMDMKSLIYCNICSVREYSFTVVNSDKHMHNPVYLCRVCFNSFHYVDGKKIGDFQAYLMNPNESHEIFSQSDEEDESDLEMEQGIVEDMD